MTQSTKAQRPIALILIIVAGLALMVLYIVLRALKVGKIGQPTDIGGGGIFVLGIIVTIVGVTGYVKHLVRRAHRK